LLIGIAKRESSYRQFSKTSRYGTKALWPTESMDGGGHVGLMQVQTTMKLAWNWLSNALEGANLFKEKLSISWNRMQTLRDRNPGLRELTAVELENMALLLYGPYSSKDLGEQYYTVGTDLFGRVKWVVNKKGNPNGVQYAKSVRKLLEQ